MRRIEAVGRQKAMSTVGAAVHVDTEASPCPQCMGSMRIQKTVERYVVTLEHGPFIAKETVLVCSAGCTYPSGKHVIRRSDELSLKVAAGANYGYDLEVHIGLERYLYHRQREEIRAGLENQHGIMLSSGEISTLGDRFLRHLEALHHSRAGAIKAVLARDGGYPLHIDATGENGRGTLFVAYAGWREWVLGAWKLSTERAELILPCLREVADSFGPPVAFMRDLGRAMIEAVRSLVCELGDNIRDLACHLHFLSDIGNDLLDAPHDELRELFRRFGIKTGLRKMARDFGRRMGKEVFTLRFDVRDWADTAIGHALPAGRAGLAAVRSIAQWVLDYPSDSSHLDFPFDRPYLDLYERCRTARRAVDAFLRRPPEDSSNRRALQRLACLLNPVVSEDSFARVAGVLSNRAGLLDELRNALRLHPKKKTEPLPEHTSTDSAERAAVELQDIRKALDVLTGSLLQRRPERGPAQDTRQAMDIILRHIEKHGKSLWGHIVELPGDVGGGIRLIARTNNILENLFHVLKHGERRRSGRKILTHDLECLPAAALLTHNLTKQDYVELLCGSLSNLPKAFAELDRIHSLQPDVPRLSDIRTELVSASLPQADRYIVRSPELRKRIEAAAKSRAPRYASAGV